MAPVTVTPGTVAPRNKVPLSTLKVTLRLRLATFGSRLASKSATLIPPMLSGTSSWPFWVPGRVLTGASFCST
ncbi:hypothetical protein D3C71_2135130 [compost metagenome]